MPERRVDGIAKSEPIGWSSSGLGKPVTSPLRILSGQLNDIPLGKTMTAVVQNTKSGVFTITLNDETLTLKGLPPTLTGKQADFIAQQSKSGGKTITQLFWTGISRTNQPAATPLAIRSDLPAMLTPGSAISARVESIQAGHMQLRIEGGVAGNHTIITTTVAGIKPGQLLTGMLQEVDGKPAFLTRSASGAEARAPLQQNSPPLTQAATSVNHALATMRPGDTALAIVEKVLGHGRVQLSLQGNRIDTPAPPSITAGDGLIVKKTDKTPSFDVLSVQPNVIGKAHALVRQQAATSIPLAESLTAIRNLLAPLPVEALRTIPVLSQLQGWLSSATVDQDTPLNGERLAGMIQQSGQLLEHKLLQHGPLATSTLQDLKAILLAIASSPLSESSIRHLAQRLAELGHSAASRIESTQALNLLAQTHTDAMRIELPMLVNQQMVNIQMSIEQQQLAEGEADQGHSEQAACKVLIALDMSRLGKLRVDATISDKAVHARIHARAEAREVMQSHIQRLESRLLNLGFSEIYLVTTPAQPVEEMQQRFEQLEQMKPASHGLLDIRI